MKRKVPVKLERSVFPYVLLWSACDQTLKRAQAAEKPFLDCMTSMLFSAFCLEAYLNHLLMMKYQGDWHGAEWLKTDKKLNELSRIIGYTPDCGTRPFQTFKVIFDFRNAIAHAKTERMTQVKHVSAQILIDDFPPIPLTE